MTVLSLSLDESKRKKKKNAEKNEGEERETERRRGGKLVLERRRRYIWGDNLDYRVIIGARRGLIFETRSAI
ncbi:hypothetical protein Sjap_001823 [Stephania japonica]|uniref:Uncharacterized protein n=1 Tax=Stephania japonica TaxID=461633 RepID=A0AAP0PRW3_9MAGN